MELKKKKKNKQRNSNCYVVQLIYSKLFVAHTKAIQNVKLLLNQLCRTFFGWSVLVRYRLQYIHVYGVIVSSRNRVWHLPDIDACPLWTGRNSCVVNIRLCFVFACGEWTCEWRICGELTLMYSKALGGASRNVNKKHIN